jgi:low affinity Fe/Cu permease
MKRIYHHTESIFEKLTAGMTLLLGNSITFIFALILVVFWLIYDRHWPLDVLEYLRDVIHGIIFLSLFIIQKSFNRFSASLHLKVNELVISHEPARNEVIVVGEGTEREIGELLKEYADLAEVEKPVIMTNDEVEQTQFPS